MVELLIATGIFVFLTAAVFGLLSVSNGNFFNTDAAIDLRNSLRLASEKMSAEIRNTGYKSGVAQFTITAGGGYNGSDTIKFSIPIVCSSSAFLLDASGNPAYWGAPLTWGCTSYTCMDANNSCTVLEYKYVKYSLNSSNKLQRDVLDAGSSVVSGSSSTIGDNITGMQISLSADGNQITMTLTGQKTSAINKTVSAIFTNKVLLNNLGG